MSLIVMFTLTVGPVLENVVSTSKYSLLKKLFKIYHLLLLLKHDWKSCSVPYPCKISM